MVLSLTNTQLFDPAKWLNSTYIGTQGGIGTTSPMWFWSSRPLYDSYRRRVVVPLVRKATLEKIGNPRFNPTFKIEKTLVVLHPLEIVSVPNEQLGDFVTSLDHEGGRIMGALDELLTQAWK
jgi:toxin CcdB